MGGAPNAGHQAPSPPVNVPPSGLLHTSRRRARMDQDYMTHLASRRAMNPVANPSEGRFQAGQKTVVSIRWAI